MRPGQHEPSGVFPAQALKFSLLCHTHLGHLKFESQVFTVSKLVLLQMRFIDLHPLGTFPSIKLGEKQHVKKLLKAF